MRLICLAGPTGAGKSAAALLLARELGGVVINADSRQVYRDFPLITAQPSAQERAVCPHRLYGVLDTVTPSSAGWWSAAAEDAMQRCAANQQFPLLVGGTGLYMRALLDGIVEIPPIPPEVSARLEAELAELNEMGNSGESGKSGGFVLHARLAGIDPAYSARIHPNDTQRLLRALAVYESTGHSFSWWHSQTPPPAPHEVVRLGLRLPLAELAPRLAARVDAMLDQGAVAEASTALDHCDNPRAPGWSGIGCAELYEHLHGTLSLDEARARWVQNTRAYAKRQLTWFNADKRIVWFCPGEEQKLLEHFTLEMPWR